MYSTSEEIDRRVGERLRRLYGRDDPARQFFEWAAQRTNDAAQTSVERLAQKTGLDRRAAIEFARALEDIGCGEFIVGRRGAKSRIAWRYSLISIGEAAAGRTEKPEPLDTELQEEATESGDDGMSVAEEATLVVRLGRHAQLALIEAAPTHDAAGASALAREILESWATERLTAERAKSIQQAVSYLRSHPQGWVDDPASFFPAAKR